MIWDSETLQHGLLPFLPPNHMNFGLLLQRKLNFRRFSIKIVGSSPNINKHCHRALSQRHIHDNYYFSFTLLLPLIFQSSSPCNVSTQLELKEQSRIFTQHLVTPPAAFEFFAHSLVKKFINFPWNHPHQSLILTLLCAFDELHHWGNPL